MSCGTDGKKLISGYGRCWYDIEYLLIEGSTFRSIAILNWKEFIKVMRFLFSNPLWNCILMKQNNVYTELERIFWGRDMQWKYKTETVG